MADADSVSDSSPRFTERDEIPAHHAEAFRQGHGSDVRWGWHCLICDAEEYVPTMTEAEAGAAAHMQPSPQPTMIQVPPLTVQEWGALRSTLHGAGLLNQYVTHGPTGGMLRVNELPEPFQTAYRKVCNAHRAD